MIPIDGSGYRTALKTETTFNGVKKVRKRKHFWRLCREACRTELLPGLRLLFNRVEACIAISRGLRDIRPNAAKMESKQQERAEKVRKIPISL